MKRTKLGFIILVTTLFFDKIALAQNINELCNTIRQDITEIKTKLDALNTSISLEQLKSQTGAMLETWKIKTDDYNNQCASMKCLQNTELWNKAQAARQMRFYISNIDELLSSDFTKEVLVKKIDNFSKSTLDSINKVCTAS